MTREDALRKLLQDVFDADELRRWLKSGPPALVAVADAIPEAGTSLEALVHEAVAAMVRHGVLDEALFRALLRARPRRLDEIRKVAARWGHSIDAEPLEALTRAEQVAALEALLVERERHLKDGQVPADLGPRIDALVRAIMAGGRPKAGDVVAGARLLKPVGNGNFGTIWLAEGLDEDKREIAVKVFHLEKLAEGVMLWRFRRSIKAMKRLAEDRRAPPTIARLYEVAPDTLAFSMPFFKGGNLEDIAKRGWTREAKLERFLEIARAVAFAHQVGIIHRDIKPANVVVDADGRPVLTDFDISDIKFATKLSTTGGGLGTPIFAAPEQLEQGDQADERSDIYSLGRLLHFLLLERSPGYQDERDPSLANLSAFPEALVAVVRRACQWDPRRRYPEVGALIRDVEECQSGWAAARAYTRRGVRWVKYNWSLLLIAGLVSGGSLGGYVWQREKAEMEAGLRQQLSEALKRLEALDEEQKAITARGQEIATQIAGFKHERDLLLARLERTDLSTQEREDIAARIAEKEAKIREMEDLQRKNAEEMAALTAQIQEARRKAERAQRGGQEATPPPSAAVDGAAEPAPEPEMPSAFEPVSGCGVASTGGPTGRAWATDATPTAPMRFLGLSAGRFCMGSPDGVGSGDERPQHAVRVSGFLVGQSEVTQAQWLAGVRAAQAAGDADAAGLEEDPSNFKGGTRPVEQVSWCDAARFANALSRLEGLSPAYTVGADCEKGGAVAWDKNATGFRLPTEAEWEYAARAGTNTAYATGDTEADLARAGWYDGNSGGQTHAVCTAAEKPWGLCDLHGNVWEWIWDWYDKYPSAEVGNPAGPSRGGLRVLRGGSWSFTPGSARSADRYVGPPSNANRNAGFRLVLPAVPSEPVEGGS